MITNCYENKKQNQQVSSSYIHTMRTLNDISQAILFGVCHPYIINIGVESDTQFLMLDQIKYFV